MSRYRKRRLITAALPYVNNAPHLGNLIGSILSADCFARHSRKAGYKVMFISGTDEYGTAIEMTADELGIKPNEVCDMNYKIHKELYDFFQINFDYFGRTTDEAHKENVIGVFNDLNKNGYIDSSLCDQYYCEKCKVYLADRYLVGTCRFCSEQCRGDQCDNCGKMVREILEPFCKLCGNIPVVKQSQHYFLKLSELKPDINRFYIEKSKNWTENARDICYNWLNIDLHDRCITRDLKYNWGVNVPGTNKVFYVWFDALIGYYTFLKHEQ